MKCFAHQCTRRTFNVVLNVVLNALLNTTTVQCSLFTVQALLVLTF